MNCPCCGWGRFIPGYGCGCEHCGYSATAKQEREYDEILMANVRAIRNQSVKAVEWGGVEPRRCVAGCEMPADDGDIYCAPCRSGVAQHDPDQLEFLTEPKEAA